MTEKGPDGGKKPVGGKKPDGALPLFIGGGDHAVVRGGQKQRYENLGKWVYILIFDCGEVVKNTHSMQTTHYSCTPSPQSGPLPL